MTDNAELQQKIAALQGRIQKHKQPVPSHRGGQHFAQRGHRGSARWTPFGRGGWPAHQPNHRNRVLVLGAGQQNGTPANDEPANAAAAAEPPTPAKQGFVTSHAAGKKQLMTQDVFLREQQLKQNNQQSPAPQSPSTPVVPKPADLNKPTAQRTHELVIEGLRFEVQAGGSKLIRISDSASANKETPKKVTVANVQFLRTKHGNLIRAAKSNDPASRVRAPQCENFTKHGTCSFGPTCRYTHDPTKVAICKDFLRTGTCKAGRNCDLSHETSYHRVPACTHFLRGNCTNSACRYPHVNVSPAASVCRPFATLGFCTKGVDCDKRHVFECPDYANHGRCAAREKGTCSLPHIDRAGNLRKAAQRQGKIGSEDDSDVSSSDEEDNEDYDSDVAEDIVMADDSHELSQQKDFIAFS